MKKFLLTILLAALVASQTGACANGASSSANCQCAGSQASFPVNCPVVINTPSTIAPPSCVTPNIPVPVVCPPTVNIPNINTPNIQACVLTAPQVIAPPTVTPPTVIVPVVNPPYIPLPPLPPQVPSPSCPPTRPTGPIIAPPAPSCSEAQLSNILTLTFQYACRQGVAFNSCEGEILWNNVEIVSIVPTDYNVHTVTINVTAVGGQNFLQIEGAGISDSYGLTVDNVQLVRVGTTQNIVINGNFENPNQYGSWSIQNNIQGWVGQGIEVGRGTIYNNQWTSQVCELDGNINFEITQYFTFDAQYNLISNTQAPTGAFSGQTLTYTLEFDYAARYYGASGPATSQANVLWNNFVIASIVSADYLVHHFSQQVQLIPGNNLLELDAAGVSDSYGLDVANVKLTSAYDSTNLIADGNFAGSGLGSTNWNYFSAGFQGWWAKLAEVGHCYNTYNPNWPNNGQLCIELDTDSNQRYLQTITISQQQFSSLLIYIQTQAGTQNAQNNLACAAADAQQNLNSAVAIIQDQILCQVNFQVSNFNNYLNQLYQCSNQAVQGLHDNDNIAVNEFDYTLQAYTYAYGCSDEADFDDSYFQGQNQGAWNGHIDSINGKVITCHDDNGNHYHLQVAPCTHFEGQFPLPRIGDKIYWQGVPDSCGRTYVSVATTCNC